MPRVEVLFVLFAADDELVFGHANVYGIMQSYMQSFLLMQKLITSERMIEIEAHVFFATNTTLICASNQRTALACQFLPLVMRYALFFSRVCSTRMRAQGRRPAIRPSCWAYDAPPKVWGVSSL